MTNQSTGEPNEIEMPPLPAEIMARIGRIEPPPPGADFWERLHAALGEDGAGSTPGTSSPSRYRVTLLAVAALVVIAGLGLQLLSRGRPDPAAERPDRGAAATAPDGPVDPGPATTVPDDTEPHQPLPGPGSDLPPADEGEPTETGSDGAGSADPPPDGTGVTTTAEPGAPPVVDATSPRATASTAAPQPPPTTAPPAAPSKPLRLEAEDNDRATDGAATWEGWQLWSNGHIEHGVSLAPGRYSVAVMAQGMASTTTRPRMEVRIDGQAIGSTLVDLTAYRLYTFTVTVGSAGAERLDIAFTNDPNRPDNDVDLKIDYTTITPLP
ncbi:MAG: carbohydrate-binding domain-containing protein [Acidimicrobiales bacterium]